jgi:DNA-binding MarR family transcriptional regulator
MKKAEASGELADLAVGQLVMSVRLINGLGMAEARRADLRPPQAAFLMFMLQVQSINMSALSRLTSITASVATRFVERLEGKGLVERFPDKDDRRVVLVGLTAEGRKTAAGLLRAQTDRLEASVREADPGLLEAFSEVLARINQYLAEQLDPAMLQGLLLSGKPEEADGTGRKEEA